MKLKRLLEVEDKEYNKLNNKEIIFIIIKIIITYISMLIVLNSTKYKDLLYVNLEQKIYKEKINNLKVALCTMGKYENLYANEFVEYHLKLGIDHIFIYDDNDPNTEKIIDSINNIYKSKVTIYDNIKGKINNQSDAFTNCYHNNINEYDWFLMIDMDEYLFIVNDTLKNYLSNKILDKCDFIKFHWATSNDNGLIYYDSRPLMERFRPPYIKEIYVKSIIRSKIKDLRYWVHSPFISPIRNVTCTNIGEIMNTSNGINIEHNDIKNFDKAFLIHFRFKTTEEFIKKYKRGYSNWFGPHLQSFLNMVLGSFFSINRLSLEKITFIEKELNLTLTKLKYLYLFRKLFFMN